MKCFPTPIYINKKDGHTVTFIKNKGKKSLLSIVSACDRLFKSWSQLGHTVTNFEPSYYSLSSLCIPFGTPLSFLP